MPHVFISYSHDSEDHKQRVKELADHLRQQGVEIILDADKMPGGPDEGWPTWSQCQVQQAEKVLIVASPRYKDIYEDPMRATSGGLGCASEIIVIRQEIYNSAGINPKYRVVVMQEVDNGCVPLAVQGYHSFRAYSPTGFNDLTNWIQGASQPAFAPSSPVSTPIPKVVWPVPPSLFVRKQADRNDQFQSFAEMVTGQSNNRILLLRGACNSGKTGLLDEMEEYAKALPLVWARADFKGAEGLENILATLAFEFESHTGILTEFVGADVKNRPSALLKGMGHLSAPIVIALDTYEQANPEARLWIEGQFLDRAAHLNAVVVVIGGQSVPDLGKNPWGRRAVLQEMPPLTEPKIWLDYAHRVLGHTHIKPEHIEMLSHAFKGDPGQISAMIGTFARAHPPSLASGSAVQAGGGAS